MNVRSPGPSSPMANEVLSPAVRTQMPQLLEAESGIVRLRHAEIHRRQCDARRNSQSQRSGSIVGQRVGNAASALPAESARAARSRMIGPRAGAHDASREAASRSPAASRCSAISAAFQVDLPLDRREPRRRCSSRTIGFQLRFVGHCANQRMAGTRIRHIGMNTHLVDELRGSKSRSIAGHRCPASDSSIRGRTATR